MDHPELILVLDFGAQYSQLIARRVRDLGVYSELHPFDLPLEQIKAMKPAGIILSGGPSSVDEPGAPLPDAQIFSLGIPVLGICYGLQIIAHLLGGAVDRSARREFGAAEVTVDDDTTLFHDIGLGNGGTTMVWMSHGDALTKIPPGFTSIAHSRNSPICAIADTRRSVYGVQFHPEVAHTVLGKEILRNFLFRICGCRGGWNAGSFVERSRAEIRKQVGASGVLCALSGGVDSSVLALLLHEIIGEQLVCMHINNGLMRKDESESIVSLFREKYRFRFHYVDASEIFLGRLAGVVDPEEKRKIIGATFIDVFAREASALGQVEFLAQGTLYPDVIESVSFRGPSHTIKTHHNVGGLPPSMPFRLIEPFRELFKDEVRAVGSLLGLDESLIRRHPFPGPGLAVRILGEVRKDRLAILREADDIFIRELRSAGLYDRVWQAFAVLLPVQTVGVMGDQRTYESVIALRAVTSRDGMTADWAELPAGFLRKVSGRIVNEVRGVNRVVYDVSSKPPSTIEWE